MTDEYLFNFFLALAAAYLSGILTSLIIKRRSKESRRGYRYSHAARERYEI